jgi:hypothetical protein
VGGDGVWERVVEFSTAADAELGELNALRSCHSTVRGLRLRTVSPVAQQLAAGALGERLGPPHRAEQLARNMQLLARVAPAVLAAQPLAVESSDWVPDWVPTTICGAKARHRTVTAQGKWSDLQAVPMARPRTRTGETTIFGRAALALEFCGFAGNSAAPADEIPDGGFAEFAPF